MQSLVILLLSHLLLVLSFVPHNLFSLRSCTTNLQVKVSKQGKPKRDRKSRTTSKDGGEPAVKVIATRTKGSVTKGFGSSGGSGFGGANTATINNDASTPAEVEEEVTADHLNSINIPSDNECPCGSKLLHRDCCQKQLLDSSTTTAAALVRSRFTAYKTSNLDYIIDTTHSDSSDRTYYYENIKIKDPINSWKKDLYRTMTRDYFYVKMEFVSQEFINEYEAKVTFRQLAVRKSDNVLYPVEEVSLLRREKTIDGSKGPWKYVKGEVLRPPSDVTRDMTTQWPSDMGMILKKDE